jgi:hypothetical protein
MENLYTQENSKLAAYVQGDPNEMHINNRFGKIIAPGLMQLSGFITKTGWRPRNKIELGLIKPIIVPSNAKYIKEDKINHFLVDNQNLYSNARISLSKPPKIPLSTDKRYSYSINYSTNLEEIKDWKNYNNVSPNLVSKIIPETDNYTLERIAAMGVSVNALVKSLRDNPKTLPELFFPKVRENGNQAILEKKLELYMGFSKEVDLDKFELAVHEPIYEEKNKKSFSIWITETSGLYGLRFELRKVHKEVLKKMLEN